MMSSLRAVAGNRAQAQSKVFAVTKIDPDERCERLKHKHLNKECFKQHPELVQKNSREREKNHSKSKIRKKG